MKKTITVTVDFEDNTESYINTLPQYIEIQADGVYLVNDEIVTLKKGDKLPIYTKISVGEM